MSAPNQIPCKCMNCQISFTIQKSRFEKRRGKFCSKKCFRQFQISNYRLVKCFNCGSEFRTFQSYINLGYGKFCSSKCARIPKKTPLDRFKDGFKALSKSECWEWISPRIKSGYGVFQAERKKYYAHRFSYEIHNGKIPEGELIMHICDNPPCVNPAHLKRGTNAHNMQDKTKKLRHRFGSIHPLAKLNESKISIIRHLLKISMTQKEIASRFGVDPSTISNIFTGKNWQRS